MVILKTYKKKIEIGFKYLNVKSIEDGENFYLRRLYDIQIIIVAEFIFTIVK